MSPHGLSAKDDVNVRNAGAFLTTNLPGANSHSRRLPEG